MPRLSIVLSTLLLSGLATSAAAQGGGSGYAGVSPDNAQRPPLDRRVSRSSVPLVTWFGFQPRAGGASRFFVQTSSSVQTTTSLQGERFQLVIKNARVHLRNNQRALETKYFNTPALRAQISRRGSDVVVTFQLRESVRPMVNTGAGQHGYHFVFVDFPAGQYVATPPPPPAESEPAAEEEEAPPPPPPSRSPRSPSLDAMDDERPPDVR